MFTPLPQTNIEERFSNQVPQATASIEEVSENDTIDVNVKPAAGRRATNDFSCDLIDKRTKGPLEMRVDC